jgi:hypothetical protein
MTDVVKYSDILKTYVTYHKYCIFSTVASSRITLSV